jgi:hypothetical protein
LEEEKNGAAWDVTPCGSCKNRRFGGTLSCVHPLMRNSCTLQPLTLVHTPMISSDVSQIQKTYHSEYEAWDLTELNFEVMDTLEFVP